MALASSPTMATAAAKKPVDPNRALRIARSSAYPKELWYLVVCVLFLASIGHLFSVLWSIRRVRQNRRSIKDGNVSSPEVTVPNARISLRRLPLAVVNAFRIVAFRWTISLGGSLRANLTEAFIVVGYLAALLTWEFINTRNITTHKMDVSYWANRAGTLTASQTPLMVALAGRNNIVSSLTGVGFEKLNIIHRGISRAVLILAWTHAFGRWRLGFTGDTTFEESWLRAGVVALASWTILIFISIRPIRNVAYEFFYYSHTVLVLIILLSAYFHMQVSVQLGRYVWPALMVWALDRTFRLCRVLLFNIPFLHRNTSPSSLEILSSDVVRLTVRRRHLSWSPGQTMFVSLPDISHLPIESHPFTIASIDSTMGQNLGERELVFIIRGRNGFTGRLRDVARDHSGRNVNVVLDGPYGCPPNLASFETVVLISGGTGVTYCLPLFLDLVKRVSEEKAVCRRIVFVWSIRVLAQMRWISASLVQALLEAPSHLQIDIRVHVTNLGADNIESPIEKLSEKIVLDGSDYDLAQLPSTPISSSSVTDEKTTSNPDLIKMRGVKIEKGRPDFKRLLEEEIACSVGPVSVDVCGPHALSDSVRSVLASEIAGPSAILKGRPSVTLHVEKFGTA